MSECEELKNDDITEQIEGKDKQNVDGQTEQELLSSNNNKKGRAKPTLELYKPPVLRDQQILRKKNRKEIAKTETIDATNQLEIQKMAKDQTSLSIAEDLIPEEFYDLESELKGFEEPIPDPPEFEELLIDLKKHLYSSDGTKIGDFLCGQIIPHHTLTQWVGEFLVKHDCGHKQTAKRSILSHAFASLAHTEVANDFCMGVVRALRRYFDCRNILRSTEEEYFPVWLNFMAATFEFGQIAREENAMQLVFDIFDYLFGEEVVNSLRIAELESILSLLMLIGRRLEQDFPVQMGQLKEILRDAFLAATEAWTRKMLLLMVELGANGWRMCAELEDFYFQ